MDDASDPELSPASYQPSSPLVSDDDPAEAFTGAFEDEDAQATSTDRYDPPPRLHDPPPPPTTTPMETEPPQHTLPTNTTTTQPRKKKKRSPSNKKHGRSRHPTSST